MTKQATRQIDRTSVGLREALFEELDGIRNGTSTPTKANAVAKLVGEVINTVQLELNVAKFLQRGHKSAPKFAALQLDK